MCNKGSNTTTTQTQPNAQAMTAYQDLLSRAGGVANTPYQPYTGQLVAPVNAQQNLGIAGTNTFANAAQPAYGAALTQAASSSAPLNAAAINQYMSPYIQGVVNSTQNQFNNQNQQQQQQVLGNAIAQGALGGNRSAVAQAELANQQQLAQAPVIANLYNQGYGQAVNTAMGEQGIGLQGAGLQGNLGAGAQSAGLQGAAAQMGAGTLQQQTQQAQDTANYGQYAQQQAYPFQTAQWLAGIDTGVGSQMGGTSQTTLPYPNPWATGLGLGTAGLGLLGQTGAFGSSGWLASALPALVAAAKGGAINLQDVAKYAHGGGVVPHFDAGGVAPMPWAGAPSWVPNASIVHGRGAPNPPGGYDPNKQMQQDAKMIGDLSKTLTGNNNSGSAFSGPAYGGGNILTDAYGGSSSNPLPGLTAADYGSMSRGGVAGVKGYDDGGTVSDADRAAGLQLLADQMSAAGYPPTPAGPPSDSDRAAGVQMLKDQMVINPNEPYRMPDQPAVKEWHDDFNNPAIVADSSPDGGVAPTQAMSFNNDKSDSTPLPSEVALGYSSDSSPQAAGIVPPSATPSSSSPGINWGADSKLWPSLVSAGFGMMASRSPFLGVAIGEGGQAGIGSYNEQQRQDFEAQKYAQDLALRAAAEKRAEEQARFSQANQMIVFDKNGKPMVNPDYIKARGELEKSYQPKWGKIDETESGREIFGWTDPNTKKVYDAAGNPYTPRNPAYAPQSPAPGTPPAAQPPGAEPISAPPAPNTPSSPLNASATLPYQVASLAGYVPPRNQQPSQITPYDPNTPVAPATLDNPNTPTPPQPVAEPPPHPADPNAPEGTDASRDTAFLARIAQEDPGLAVAIKKAANYELDPARYETMYHGARKRFMNMVFQYDRNYHPQEVGLILRAQQAFLPGTKTGDTVRAFNTAVSHLDTLREAYNAVKNGDWQTWNSLKNRFKQEFGYAPPNTLNAISQIVGGEVVKATVGAQNALGDREELRKSIESKLSNGQALDVIDHFQQLMGGQLKSLKFAYEQATHLHNFDEHFLLPRSREVLKHVEAETAPVAGQPTLDQFMGRARAANPNATDDQLRAYYNKKYGRQ